MENRFAKYAQGSQLIAPPDPKVPGQVQGQALSNTKTADEIQRERELFGFQKRKVAAEAGVAEANLRKARQQPRGPGITAAAASEARNKVKNALLFRKQLQTAWDLWKQTQKGRGLSSLGEFLPTPQNHQFDAAVDQLMPLARQLFRVPGSGADTDKEAKYIEKILPGRWSFDEKNIQKFDQLFRMTDEIVHQNAVITGQKITRQRGKRPAKQSRVINFSDLPE